MCIIFIYISNEEHPQNPREVLNNLIREWYSQIEDNLDLEGVEDEMNEWFRIAPNVFEENNIDKNLLIMLFNLSYQYL